jgi:hypothetical protein
MMKMKVEIEGIDAKHKKAVKEKEEFTRKREELARRREEIKHERLDLEEKAIILVQANKALA